MLARRSFLAAAFLVAGVAAGLAQSKTREVTLPLSGIVAMHNAIMALDTGSDRLDKEGKTAGKEPYKLERGFRISMSRNITALRPIIEGYEKEIAALRAELLPSGQIKPGSPELQRLNDENTKLMGVQHKANLYTFKESDLNLDVNTGITMTMISSLAPIME